LATLDYRFSNVARYPAQIQDCKAAIRWLRANAAQNNIDPNRIGVWGASAGGHLADLLGTTGNTRQFDVGDNLNVSSSVQAVCDFYGPTDFYRIATDPAKHFGPSCAEWKLLGGSPAQLPDLGRLASPISFVGPGAPPFLIVHGTNDTIVSPVQSQVFYDALIKAGVRAELHIIPGARHGGDPFYTPEIHNLVQSFFDKYLKPNPTNSSPTMGSVSSN
jgi:acetyl esterase/lipase